MVFEQPQQSLLLYMLPKATLVDILDQEEELKALHLAVALN